MKGTVVHLDRGSKSRGIGLKEQRLGRDAGAVSGIIKVDKGPLIGALVTFHRRYIGSCFLISSLDDSL